MLSPPPPLRPRRPHPRAASPSSLYLRDGAAGVGLAGTLAVMVGPAAAEALLGHFGSLAELAAASVAALAAAPGVGPRRAATVHAAFALARQAAEAGPRNGRVTTAPEAAAWLVPRLSNLPHEELHALFVDRRSAVIRVARMSQGSIDHTVLDARAILGEALRVRASGVILAHNHPSGDLDVSLEDRAATRRVVDAGRVVGVQVADHLVVCGTRWISMALRGEMPS